MVVVRCCGCVILFFSVVFDNSVLRVDFIWFVCNVSLFFSLFVKWVFKLVGCCGVF